MKIICIGRNYHDHIKELNNEIPDEPVVFMKPDSSIVLKKFPFVIPEFSENIEYETEVVVKINKIGKYINKKFAHKYYDQIGLGIDFTARDLQQKLKEKGLPWEKSKSFDGSTVMGNFISKTELRDVNNIDFSLNLNGVVVQNGNTSNMIHSIDEIIEHISQYFTLKIGDLIFTGTPSGVGKVSEGDVLKGYIGEQEFFSINVK
ncbi:MAG: fumarylacetoacetate hydrolase family protein [Ichthyobacteriaceae bacterium]|nr:fumarylacetoacetate hydrolase family protein [Ichthyobacteriaceae bacterium]